MVFVREKTTWPRETQACLGRRKQGGGEEGGARHEEKAGGKARIFMGRTVSKKPRYFFSKIKVTGWTRTWDWGPAAPQNKGWHLGTELLEKCTAWELTFGEQGAKKSLQVLTISSRK